MENTQERLGLVIVAVDGYGKLMQMKLKERLGKDITDRIDFVNYDSMKYMKPLYMISGCVMVYVGFEMPANYEREEEEYSFDFTMQSGEFETFYPEGDVFEYCCIMEALIRFLSENIVHGDVEDIKLLIREYNEKKGDGNARGYIILEIHNKPSGEFCDILKKIFDQIGADKLADKNCVWMELFGDVALAQMSELGELVLTRLPEQVELAAGVCEDLGAQLQGADNGSFVCIMV